MIPGRVVRVPSAVADSLKRASREGRLVEVISEMFLDYKLLVDSRCTVEAILLLSEYGGPTTWVLITPEDGDIFDELADMLKPCSS